MDKLIAEWNSKMYGGAAREAAEITRILSENWETITADLEMIQGEGFDAIFQVDPNMVVKKKKEDEDEVTEVQEGWKP